MVEPTSTADFGETAQVVIGYLHQTQHVGPPPVGLHKGTPWARDVLLQRPYCDGCWPVYARAADIGGRVTCPTCNGMDPEDYIHDPPCTVCPTCKGEMTVPHIGGPS